ncbi:hypothetical protein [Bifidobacterium tibiigranuli]|jgi:hypothetical protein|uniref:hypothetical protein n=1 Tax=Bifidobacterium tibiigranuli TaxID=2172043 RepID=UPI0023521159|nr:hypothetical protein [Bifidobacterium tibiigranuli]MCH3975073.1 hypothetical protein [Bifidobacterium tibiigranuli]
MDPLVIDVFDALGSPMFRLPYTSCNWSDTINDPGSLNVDVTYTTTTMKVPKGLYNQLKLWGVILAAHRYDPATDSEDVKHAGPLVDYRWDAKGRRLSLLCGGRLVADLGTPRAQPRARYRLGGRGRAGG